jgi:hypothetical protein
MEFLAYSKNCTHFSNKNQIYASCCNKFYDCHLCHNEQVTDHKITRKYITKIKCIECCSENKICNKSTLLQDPSACKKPRGCASENICTTCNIQFAKNYCEICKIWCSKIESFFHCDICDCCHIGIKENFFHCDTCKICLSNNCKDNHICKYLDKKSNCPICLEQIFNKIETPIALKQKSTPDPPYGCLKGGNKPTYRSWNTTQKIRDYVQPNLAFSIPVKSHEETEREKRLNVLREKIKTKQHTAHNDNVIMSTNNVNSIENEKKTKLIKVDVSTAIIESENIKLKEGMVKAMQVINVMEAQLKDLKQESLTLSISFKKSLN